MLRALFLTRVRRSVLSVFTLLHSEAAAHHAALMSAAAAVGDFEEWASLDSATEQAQYRTGDCAVKLDMALKALGEAAGGDAAAYAVALEALPDLLAPGGCAPPVRIKAACIDADTCDVFRLLCVARLAAQEALWRDSYDQLCAAWDALQSPTGALQARRGGRGGRVGIVTHSPGAAEVPGPALSRFFGGPHAAPPRTLLAFAQPGGITWHYRCATIACCMHALCRKAADMVADVHILASRWELPRHCWARTLSRPNHTAPDAAALSLALDAAAREAAAHEAAAAALGVRNWAADGMPGMTGVLRTRAPLAASPSAVAAALERADAALAADARASQQPAAPPPVWGAAAYAR